MSGRHAKDETGKRYGRWTVIGKASSRYRSIMWLCRCDCGTERAIKGWNLRGGHTKSCGCARKLSEARQNPESKEKHRPRPKFKGKCRLSPRQAAINRFFSQYRTGARRKGFVFALSLSEFESLTLSDCYYCGSVPQNIVHGWQGKGAYECNGIDRLDSDVGYVAGNCVPCCTMCNMAKRTTSVDEFRNWIARVYEYLYRIEHPMLFAQGGPR